MSAQVTLPELASEAAPAQASLVLAGLPIFVGFPEREP